MIRKLVGNQNMLAVVSRRFVTQDFILSFRSLLVILMLARQAASQQASDPQASAVIFRVEHTANVLQFRRQSARDSGLQRYKLLLRTVLPPRTFVIRVDVDFSPTHPSPSVAADLELNAGGRRSLVLDARALFPDTKDNSRDQAGGELIAPLIDLVESARSPGKVDELRELVDQRRAEDVRSRKSRLALLAVIAIAAGDFDIIAASENLHSTAANGGNGNVHLLVALSDERVAACRIYRKHNVTPSGGVEQIAQSAIFQRRNNDTHFDFPTAPAEESASGRLRLSRRGARLYYLYAADDSPYYRLIHTEEVGDSATIEGGIKLILETHLKGLTSVVWTELVIRAESISGLAFQPSYSIAELDAQRDKLTSRAEFDFNNQTTYETLHQVNAKKADQLRLARRGELLYVLFQGSPDETAQILGLVEVGRHPVPSTWLRVQLHTGGTNRKTKVRFESLNVHAEKNNRPDPSSKLNCNAEV